MKLVRLLKLCLSFEFNEATLKEIDEGFRLWVQAYEKCVPFSSILYYTHNFVVYTI